MQNLIMMKNLKYEMDLSPFSPLKQIQIFCDWCACNLKFEQDIYIV